MPLSSARVSVGTTAVVVTSGAAAFIKKVTVVLLHKGPASIFIGGSDVSLANGFELAANLPLSLELEVDDPVYALVASGTVEVSILKVD